MTNPPVRLTKERQRLNARPGAFKSRASVVERGGKRSATPLWGRRCKSRQTFEMRKRVASRKRCQPISPPATALHDARRCADRLTNSLAGVERGGKRSATPLWGRRRKSRQTFEMRKRVASRKRCQPISPPATALHDARRCADRLTNSLAGVERGGKRSATPLWGRRCKSRQTFEMRKRVASRKRCQPISPPATALHDARRCADRLTNSLAGVERGGKRSATPLWGRRCKSRQTFEMRKRVASRKRCQPISPPATALHDARRCADRLTNSLAGVERGGKRSATPLWGRRCKSRQTFEMRKRVASRKRCQPISPPATALHDARRCADRLTNSLAGVERGGKRSATPLFRG